MQQQYLPAKEIDRPVKVIFSVLILLAAGALAFALQRQLLDRVLSFRSPLLAGQLATSSQPLPPVSDRVVLVIVSGLNDASASSQSMVTLNRMRQSGAWATMTAATPTYRQAAWLTLLTGVTQPLSDAPLLDVQDTLHRPVQYPTLFNLAVSSGVETALYGQHYWTPWIDTTALTRHYFGPETGGDDRLNREMEAALKDSTQALIVLQLGAVDQALRVGNAEDYETALTAVDTTLQQVLELVDLAHTTVIVSADFGHIEGGGHGGADVEVITLPLVLYGKGIIAGEYSPVQQVDVAPTIGALLGIGFSSVNQGRPLLEMLKLSATAKSEQGVALARNHFQLAQIYLTALQQPLRATDDITTLEDFLQNKNYAGAAVLAPLVVAETDAAMNAATEQTKNQGRWLRLVVSVILLFGVIFFLLRYRSDLWVEAWLSGAAMVAGYHLGYLLTDQPYSLSAIHNLTLLWGEIWLRTLTSLALGTIFFAVILLLQQFNHRPAVLDGAFEMILVALVGFAAPVLYAFWREGIAVDLIFPDVTHLFYALTGLRQIFWLVLLGVFVPPMLVTFNMLSQFLLNRYQTRNTQKG